MRALSFSASNPSIPPPLVRQSFCLYAILLYLDSPAPQKRYASSFPALLYSFLRKTRRRSMHAGRPRRGNAEETWRPGCGRLVILLLRRPDSGSDQQQNSRLLSQVAARLRRDRMQDHTYLVQTEERCAVGCGFTCKGHP